MQTPHRRAHLRIWLGLAVLLPAILLGALALRPTSPAEPPVRIAPP